MKAYIGTKLIKATPMTRQEYNDYRGWDLPEDEKLLAEEAGFLVEYVDGGRANDSRHEGYISWSPANVFPYQDTTEGMTFGHAIELLKRGHKVARKGWNGKGMWLGLVEDTFAINFTDPTANGELREFENHPYIVMKTVDGKIVPWLASQSDVLADDWVLIA